MQLPTNFIQNIEKQIGNADHFVQTLNSPAPVSIRMNPFKRTHQFDEMEKVDWHQEGSYLQERPIFTLDPLFHAGAYYVQEASSMFLHEVLRQSVDLNSSLKVLDLCAAPGGKSTLLASAVSNESFLLLNEVIRKRVGPLLQNLTKWGNTNVMVSNHDPGDFADLNHFFDVVVVDAPCSGEGLFRKDPNARKEWSLEHVAHCSARQKRILKQAKELVSARGVLIYSTCTYNHQENDENVDWLLKEGGFEKVNLDLPAEWNIDETQYGYQFYPHKIKGEGFYIAAIRKTENTPIPSFRDRWVQDLNALSKKEIPLINDWVKEPDTFSFFQKPNDEVVAIPKNLSAEFNTIANALKRRSIGLHVGIFKNKKFIPSHALALSNACHPDLPSIELERQQALLFLKKETFGIPSDKMGWHLVKHQGLNLGWVKLLGNRFNNYLPKEWRIRMDLK